MVWAVPEKKHSAGCNKGNLVIIPCFVNVMLCVYTSGACARGNPVLRAKLFYSLVSLKDPDAW